MNSNPKMRVVTKTIQVSSSSSSDSSLNISSPINANNFLNLATPTPSPNPCIANKITTPPPTIIPSDPTPPSVPSQPSKTPSPQSPKMTPMELFKTPPTSPHPLMETLDDLPPRSSNPPPLPLFDTMEQMETQQQPRSQPSNLLEEKSHQPSLIERLAYKHARPSIFTHDQDHPHQ
jgi:hypothetical protein